MSGLQTLTKRRKEICKKLSKDDKLSGPLKKLFAYNSVVTNHEHNLDIQANLGVLIP